MPRVAYLGPEGTFTEAALLQMAAANMVPVTDFEPFPTGSPSAALEMVRAGDADYACVPIENSIEGSVLPTLDSLAAGSLVQIFAEFTLDIAFTIAARSADAEPASIAAYPVARAQVARWVA
ncbi:prephenate dehydratase domain-containing protein, partial [Mycobacterium sp.]|uniref:prephenate dehydratase domain-containing protein n=1 Tax=Mycobacterium sp. TaxID=1785 RepID=UPI0028BF15D1